MPADAIATDAAPKEIRLADYRPPAFLIDTVDLTFHLDEDATSVVSRLSVRRAGIDTALFLDGEALTLLGVTMDGAAVEPRIVEGGLFIDDMPDACVLEIRTRISPKANSELTGLYVSGGNY